MTTRSVLSAVGALLAIGVPVGMLACAALYTAGTLSVPHPVWSALDPLPLTIELLGPAGLLVAVATWPRWGILVKAIVAVLGLPAYLLAEFYALIALSGAMGEPF